LQGEEPGGAAVAAAQHIPVFNCLDLFDLCHTPPDSGERLFKSRTQKRLFDTALRAGGLQGEEPSVGAAVAAAQEVPPRNPRDARRPGSSSLLLSILELSDAKVL